MLGSMSSLINREHTPITIVADVHVRSAQLLRNVIRHPVATLGLVSPGAETDGCRPIFPEKI